MSDYVKHSDNRVQDYIKRGYPEQLLREAQSRARNVDRDTLLTPKPKQNGKKKNSRVPLIVQFNPANPHFNRMIDKNWHLLQLCSKKEAF